MILQSLVRYYEILREDPESGIPIMGYSKANVSYAVNISKEGEIINVIPLKIPSGKGSKEIPVSMLVPEQEKKTVNIKSNFLCENSSYVFGIDNKDKPDRARKCFEAFKELHWRILKDVECDEARALLNYIDNWSIDKAETHPALKEHLDDIKQGGNIVFQLEGKPRQYIHENELIKAAWERYKKADSSPTTHICLVTGKREGIARLHPIIKGIVGGQPMGNSLISYNNTAYESYGKQNSQGLNSSVGEYAAFAYTTVLNHLLKDQVHKTSFGDTTVVFWAETKNNAYRDCLSLFLDPSQLESDDGKSEEKSNIYDPYAVREVKNIMEKISMGQAVRISDDTFNEKTNFYILGLSPNAARLSVRFFIKDSFGNLINQITKHYQDMSIEKQYDTEPNAIPIWRLLYETVSPKSKEKSSSPLLSGATLRSILQGLPYPMSLYQAIILRIRAEKTINYYKASIIKAFLIRNYPEKNYREVLTMALNEDYDNKAYILGRLFAVLEKAQEDANPGINTTIKDRYFTSACATPASVFPVLLRLSNHHIAKAQYGYVSENRLKNLLDKLKVEENPFPSHLSMEEQGVFILGYYHQKNHFYKKIEKENENE